MGTCSNCWWEDKGTGVCCHEESEYNLCNVNSDNVCPLWSARDGSNFEEFKQSDDELPFTDIDC